MESCRRARQSRLGAILGESRDGVWGESPSASLQVLNFEPCGLHWAPFSAGPGSVDLNIHNFPWAP